MHDGLYVDSHPRRFVQYQTRQDPKVFIPKSKLTSSIIKLATEISLFSLQISKNLMFCVDKIEYEIFLAILSNLKLPICT